MNNNSKKQKKEEKFLIINNVFKFSKTTYNTGLNFKWPEYKSERERIRLNTEKYSQNTITEAFEKEYQVRLNTLCAEAESTPRDLKIGDIINTSILDVSKRQVTFDTRSTKASLYSAVDLSKYNSFCKDNIYRRLPVNGVEAEVVDITKHGVKVDVLKPMIENYVKRFVNSPWLQKVLKAPIPITVTNLKLVRGGFLGKAILPNVSNFLGETYYVDAFIPGSQIVLNITDDFERFEGQTVNAFIVNYMQKPGSQREMSLVCSVKEYLKFQGERTMVNLFNQWCDESDYWKEFTRKIWGGVVTGVINSSKKCGVFIEIPSKHITGMLNVSPKDLVNYKPGDQVMVRVAGFEEEMFYNFAVGQTQHVEPYKITSGCLEKCTLKPIFALSDTVEPSVAN